MKTNAATENSKPMQLGPVFVLSAPRGGSTVLARILNCHPQLVIWGEHVGLINRLAEIDDMVSRVGHLMYAKTEEAIADYVTFSDQHLTLFEPWANPFDRDSFRDSCRSLIEKIFTRGLRPGQRWGFKEVRYHRVLTAQFLVDLFPDAQFVILTRDTQDVAVSSILAPWSLRWFWDYRDVMPAELAEAIIRDVTYALLVVEAGLDAVRTHLGPRCLHLDYSRLRDPNGSFIAQLFGFLGLTISESIAARIGKVLEVRAGASDRDTCFGNLLSSSFIRERMATLVSEMQAQIARDGPDRSRLVAREGTGQYSFLVGDHTMRDRGSEFSSMF